jgi:hypothetical protein
LASLPDDGERLLSDAIRRGDIVGGLEIPVVDPAGDAMR